MNAYIGIKTLVTDREHFHPPGNRVGRKLLERIITLAVGDFLIGEITGRGPLNQCMLFIEVSNLPVCLTILRRECSLLPVPIEIVWFDYDEEMCRRVNGTRDYTKDEFIDWPALEEEKRFMNTEVQRLQSQVDALDAEIRRFESGESNP